jgi:hypothetical protein
MVLSSWDHSLPISDAAGALTHWLKSVKRDAKLWARRKRTSPTLPQNCKFIIFLLDLFQEDRRLSAGEVALRKHCQEALELDIKECIARWKIRAKCRKLKEGDVNTRYFHARATQRHRRNQINVLEVDGVPIASHAGKTQALTEHLCSILDVAPEVHWDFDVEMLYAGAPRAVGASLIIPFRE